LRLVGTDRNDHALVAQYDLRDPRRRHADALLTGADALDDRYVGVPHFMLDAAAKIIPVLR